MSLPSKQETIAIFSDGSSVPVSKSSVPLKLKGKQLTVSEGHPWPPKSGSKDDIGGHFYSQRQYIIGKPKIAFAGRVKQSASVTRMFQYSGYAFPVKLTTDSSGTVTNFPPANHSDISGLDALGATAVANSNPGNPIESLSSALGEMMLGGTPSVISSSTWKDRTLTAKKAGGEYLNTVFGWLPLVNDVRGIADVIANSDSVLTQYERDAGKVVRRRFNFPIERVVEEHSFPGLAAWLGEGDTHQDIPFGTPTRRRETSTRRWFSGAFTYYLPTGYDSRNALSRLALLTKLLGAEPSPETLWELTPWSWAVDWFSNAGDVISNLTAFKTDGQVLRYGYMMEHTIVKDTWTYEGCRLKGGGSVAIPPVTLVTETKLRRRANPYGFGVSWNGLSPFQSSIVAALGITKK